ncbi:MAG: hypothetical protein LBT65_04760 [Synergistaceae bacterium]|nr:hypothetical protein [Synergistaceae bacterium]
MVCSVVTGYFLYLERYPVGLSLFALTALLLFFAMSDLSPAANQELLDYGFFEPDAGVRRTLTELALLTADNALNGVKNIGRALPCTPIELSALEDRLIPLLDELDVPTENKKNIVEEIDRLRARSRQTEGRKALRGGRR